jgi:hypothetical protein
MRAALHLRPEGPEALGLSPLGVLCPAGAIGLSPGFQPGFNPGNRHPERRALKLTRHMNVRSLNKTRSSGLEMLKGRQIERTNHAAEESNGRTSQLCTANNAEWISKSLTGSRSVDLKLQLVPHIGLMGGFGHN